MTGTQLGQADVREHRGRLMALFDRLVPLIDGVADSLRLVLIVGFLAVVWIFVWMHYFNDLSFKSALLLCGMATLPLLMLTWYWRGLEALKTLPESVAEMVDDTAEDMRRKVQGIRDSHKKPGLLGSAGKLWEMRSLLGEVRDMLGSYVHIGALVNPLVLVLGFLSLLCVGGLGLLAIILAVIAIF